MLLKNTQVGADGAFVLRNLYNNVCTCICLGYKTEEHLDKGESGADLFVPSERLIIIINLMRVANYPQQIADERRRPRKKYFDRLSAEVAVGSAGGRLVGRRKKKTMR